MSCKEKLLLLQYAGTVCKCEHPSAANVPVATRVTPQNLFLLLPPTSRVQFDSRSRVFTRDGDSESRMQELAVLMQEWIII
jgi:hypothetical protein